MCPESMQLETASLKHTFSRWDISPHTPTLVPASIPSSPLISYPPTTHTYLLPKPSLDFKKKVTSASHLHFGDTSNVSFSFYVKRKVAAKKNIPQVLASRSGLYFSRNLFILAIGNTAPGLSFIISIMSVSPGASLQGCTHHPLRPPLPLAW